MIFGPELWRTIADIEFSYWDRWLLRLALDEADGFTGLIRFFEARRKTHDWSDAEAKLSQIDDLTRRLAQLGLEPRAFFTPEELHDTRLHRRALDKLFRQRAQHLTPAMENTPRRRFEQRSRRGRWHEFPRSPADFEPSLLSTIGRDRVQRWRRTLQRARDLDAAIEARATALPETADRLALYRAAMTVILEAMACIDDSHGAVGDVFVGLLPKYLGLPWSTTAIPARSYIDDLVDFVIWEDYGLVPELGPWFAHLAPDHAVIVEQALDRAIAELRAGGFSYHEDKALALRVDYLVARGHHHRFVEAARELGSRAWSPIVTMAKAALAADDPRLARAVFAAADQPGMHRRYLAAECVKLTGKPPASGTLYVVK